MYKPRLKELYEKEIRAKLKTQFAYANEMQIPKLEKIVINMGVGEATSNSKKITKAQEELSLIAGQAAVTTKSKHSNASFKLREGMPIGVKVTLRGNKMYEFLDRLVNIALPRVRDFRGVSNKSFDGKGNYALGLKEQLIFIEIDYDKVEDIRGMDIVMVTSTNKNEEAMAMLKEFGMPFRA